MTAVYLLRHGETEWSRNGRHTSRTDLPLTPNGERRAGEAGRLLGAMRGAEQPALIASSPRARALRTAELAGLSIGLVTEDLAEWDYGEYEGMSTPQIRGTVPGWTVWTHECPGGESAAQVGARARRVLERARAALADGDVILVGHGHFSRVLVATWLGLDAPSGVHFGLDAAAITVLGDERGVPQIKRLNVPPSPEVRSSMPDPRVRRARESDVDAMVALVHELAEYERAADECHLTAGQLHAALFGESPALFAHVAELDGDVAGCALWFRNFSTWHGTHGIYLEDLYVRPAARGTGLGKALLTALAEECVARGYARLEWWVLDWNTPAIGFYTSLGAIPMDEWTVFRLTGNALNQLAGG